VYSVLMSHCWFSVRYSSVLYLISPLSLRRVTMEIENLRVSLYFKCSYTKPWQVRLYNIIVTTCINMFYYALCVLTFDLVAMKINLKEDTWVTKVENNLLRNLNHRKMCLITQFENAYFFPPNKVVFPHWIV
jgi:hypothetical protein